MNKKNNITVGDAFASFSSYYISDSVLKSIPDDYPYLEVKGDKNIINLRFEKFTQSLVWDPIFQLAESDEPILSTEDSSNTVMYIVIGVAALILLLAAGYFLLIKNRKKNNDLKAEFVQHNTSNSARV